MSSFYDELDKRTAEGVRNLHLRAEAIENKFMVPIECDDCNKPMGYGWDSEYGSPQSVFRCAECFDLRKVG